MSTARKKFCLIRQKAPSIGRGDNVHEKEREAAMPASSFEPKEADDALQLHRVHETGPRRRMK